MKYAAPPVWTTTGPATKTMRRPGRARFAHQRGDAADAGLDAALRRDLVGHEGEVRAVALAELRGDADAFEAADDAIAGPHLAQLAARGAAVVDDDHGVHALAFDLDPLAADAHVRAQIGRRIEIVGHAAVAVGLAQQRVPLLDGAAAELHQILDQPAQAGGRRRRNLERNARELVVGAADGEIQHLERAAALDHLVEDRVENVRVDQMAFGADHRRMCARVLHG